MTSRLKPRSFQRSTQQSPRTHRATRHRTITAARRLLRRGRDPARRRAHRSRRRGRDGGTVPARTSPRHRNRPRVTGLPTNRTPGTVDRCRAGRSRRPAHEAQLGAVGLADTRADRAAGRQPRRHSGSGSGRADWRSPCGRLPRRARPGPARRRANERRERGPDRDRADVGSESHDGTAAQHAVPRSANRRSSSRPGNLRTAGTSF